LTNYFVKINKNININLQEIDSKNHLLLQTIDLIMEAIQFDINNNNKLPNCSLSKVELQKYIFNKIKEYDPTYNTDFSKEIFKIDKKYPFGHWIYKRKM
jgi:hypothetical protein